MDMDMSIGVCAPEPAEVGLAWQRARALRETVDWRQDPMDASGLADATVDPPSAPSISSAASMSGGSSTDMQPNADSDRQQQRRRDWHEQGKCTPCGYFARKSDGCWKGAACEFCHYCDNNRYQSWKRRERRSRKREVVAALQGVSLDGNVEESGDDESDAMRWQ
eukprot:TRINITY_DN12302_c0_g1_i4.p2 TRINITY_DN12302_c0_g1~~TRINITY_DN12302_c0_g1_i4.p2  ORF type:complete len:165 (+),score=30.33 TRINITY_DN12302_c0_g1_i4:240-734(+)